MSNTDREIIVKVKQWISFGDEDLNLANHGLTIIIDTPYRLIAFHAQQCVEKYLKAYLVFHFIDFPYTHNIARLLELCPNQSEWIINLEDAEELSPYAISTRYPGESEPVTETEAKEAIATASKVKEIIRKVLLDEGMII